MTACVEGKQKEKMEGGALSNKVIRAVLAAVLAIGLMPAFAGQALAATDQESWDAGTFAYSAEKNASGKYSVLEGDTFSVTSVTSVEGTVLAADEYSVLYFNNATAGTLDDTDTVVAKAKAIDGRPGGMPSVEGAYSIAILKGALPGDFVISDTTTLAQVKAAVVSPAVLVFHPQAFQ